jgi:hypothetical protein
MRLGLLTGVIPIIFIRATTSWASFKMGSLSVPVMDATDITSERRRIKQHVRPRASNG